MFVCVCAENTYHCQEKLEEHVSRLEMLWWASWVDMVEGGGDGGPHHIENVPRPDMKSQTRLLFGPLEQHVSHPVCEKAQIWSKL